jgi:polyisoprenoid-binding protein YceI
MLRTFAAAGLLGLSICTAALANPISQDPTKAPAGDYVLDKRHASLTAKIAHMGGFSRYTMRFDGLDGGYTLDPTNWQATKVTINVDAASVDTGDPSFNKQIAGYFDAAKFPTISFVSTDLTADNGKGVLTGDLTFHGVTKPVSLDVTFNGVGPGMLGAGTRMGFSGTGRIKRSDFGVTEMKQFAGDDIDLLFEVEFVKK